MVFVRKMFENEACKESVWWHFKERGVCVRRPHHQICHCVIRVLDRGSTKPALVHAIKTVVGYLLVADTIDADNYAFT